MKSGCPEFQGKRELEMEVRYLGRSMDASEIHPRRLDAKEVWTPPRRETLTFPVADGAAKLCERDHEFREPTLRREQPVWSEDLGGNRRVSTDKIKR